MSKAIIKTIIISDVTNLIAKNFKITLEEARDRFYKSDTLNTLDDESSGLYGYSSLFVYSLYLKEIKNNSDQN